MAKRKATKVTYGLDPNYRRRVDPQAAGEELDRLMKSNGGKLTASVVVAAAKNANSPLHKMARTWSTDKAAHNYWETEARTLLKAVVIISVEKGQKTFDPVYVNVPPANKQGEGTYELIVDVVSDEEKCDRALEQLIVKMDSAMRAVEEFKRAINQGSIPPKRIEVIRMALRAVSQAASAVRLLRN